MTRKERRAEAKLNGVAFEPQYNGRVITKAEYDKEVQELKESRKEAFVKPSKEVVVNEETTKTE